MRTLSAIVTATILAAASTLAMAAPAGNAVGVNPQADAQQSGQTRTLVVGADLFIGDLVETGARGQVQILFGDNTELVVGPNSALTIEDYLIRNDGTAGKLAVDVLSGVFRFATGDSAKNRYTIGTPTGTIGVRGTEFDGYIGDDKIPWVIRHDGTVVLCTEDNKCDVLDDVCEVGKIGMNGVEIVGDSRDAERAIRDLYRHYFPYTDNQQPLFREFWFRAARDCLNLPPNVSDQTKPENESINEEEGVVDGPDDPDPSKPPDEPSSEPPPDTSSEPPPDPCNVRIC